MGKKTKKIIIFLGIISLLFFKAGFILAFELHYPIIHFGGQTLSVNDTSTLGDYICYLIGLGANLAIFITVIIIAWAGVLIIFGLGVGKIINPDKGTRAPAEAREWMKAGILGLLIVVCAILIAYTINPNLAACNMGVLSLINFTENPSNSTPPGTQITTYKEIPIGTLTENLLTRTMDCYGFDQEGNPADGQKIVTDNHCVKEDSSDCPDGQRCDTVAKKCIIYLPTYLNHDRADCLAQLTDGAQKKTQIIATFSTELRKLMDTCSCSGKCDPVCDPANGGCNQPSNACPLEWTCTGACVGGACKQPPNTKDCCPEDSGIADSKNPGKNFSVKNLIEHGPIAVTINLGTCNTQIKNYNGLDEFRCPNPKDSSTPCSNIANFVEKQITVNNRPVVIINQTKWNKLNFIQQLTYFKEKINALKQKIQKDIDVLDQAKTKLDSCYLAMPYIDVLKNYEGTNQPSHIILIQKEFTDPETNKKVDASKYCEGFNYSNSSCFKKCNDRCPDTSSGAIELYKKCACTSDSDCPSGDTCDTATKTCLSGDSCIDNSDCPSEEECNTIAGMCTDKEKCIENAYNLRPCIPVDCKNDSDCATGEKCNTTNKICVSSATCTKDSDCSDGVTCDTVTKTCSITFNDCINTCQGDCKSICNNKYLACSDEYNLCISQCNNNSNCILDNAGECLFGASQFQQCASQTTDQGNTDYCIKKAYTCKNGSNEYAGYTDCVDTKISGCSATNYSASFLYDRFINNAPGCEKCPYPYKPPAVGTTCYSNTANSKSTCAQLCPETTKCLASSPCPDCPCDEISQTLKFFIPEKSKTGVATVCVDNSDCFFGEKCGPNKVCINTDGTTKTCKKSSDCSVGGGEVSECSHKICVPLNNLFIIGSPSSWYTSSQRSVKAYQMVGTQCNEYAHNDDPLTFYCEDKWWNNPDREGLSQTPIGEERVCPKTREVPVGQTVDDTYKWANALITSADIMLVDVQKIIDQMEKSGKAINTSPIQDYCKCNAKYKTNDPICITNCEYWRACGKTGCACGCAFVPCTGNSCQQVIDYLSMLWNYNKDLKDDFTRLFAVAMTIDPRSDIMKELTYSRKKTNECSLISSGLGPETKLLDCTRAKDEIISPVNTGKIIFNGQNKNVGCYGKDLGVEVGESLTDNWFCCENQQDSGSQ